MASIPFKGCSVNSWTWCPRFSSALTAFLVAFIADSETLPPIGEAVENAIFKGLIGWSKTCLLSLGKINGLSI